MDKKIKKLKCDAKRDADLLQSYWGGETPKT